MYFWSPQVLQASLLQSFLVTRYFSSLSGVLSVNLVYIYFSYMNPCHHSMVHPWIMDGGDGLQVWRIAANILNKQLQTDIYR
jgi:hypothetical protein